MPDRVRRRSPRQLSGSARFYPFAEAVMAVQGVHAVEHVLQLVQVHLFDVPGERAFDLLGYVVNFMGTAEWMHLVFNAAYLASLYVILLGAHELTVAGQVSRRRFAAFAVLGAGLETWHMTEHAVIIERRAQRRMPLPRHRGPSAERQRHPAPLRVQRRDLRGHRGPVPRHPALAPRGGGRATTDGCRHRTSLADRAAISPAPR